MGTADRHGAHRAGLTPEGMLGNALALGAALLAGLGAVWLVKLIARATSALWHKIKELLIKKEQ